MNIFYTNFHLGWGGQPLQVLQLAGAMQTRGHNVTIFAPAGSELAERAQKAGLPTTTQCRFPRGLRPLQVGRDITALRHAILQKQADIIHCHGSQDCWITAGALLGLKDRCKLIRTKHNSYPAKRHRANNWLYNSAIDRTICVADPIRDELIHDGFVSADRTCVLHAGLDDNFEKRVITSRREIRAEFGIAEEAPLIGLVGRLAPDKGQDTLISAMETVRRELPDAKALLIGTGGDWDRIRALIEQKGLQETVLWAGFRDDVPSVTAALDLSLLAARACDASSTVLKEAMVLAVPVIGTDVGGTKDILDQGRCGRLIQPGDAAVLAQAILEILRDREATATRVSAARDHVRQYLAGHIAAETEAVYQAVRS